MTYTREPKRNVSLSLEDPEVRQRFEESLRRWEERGRPAQDASRASERLSQDDFTVRINARM